MKRILIVNNNMHIGGVQKALLNLLQTLHADYDITLLLFYRGGALLNEVPSDVRVCAADGAFRYFGRPAAAHVLGRYDARAWNAL